MAGENEQQDYLEMSDEDIMNMSAPELVESVEAPASDSAADVPGTDDTATGEQETETPPEPVVAETTAPEAKEAPEVSGFTSSVASSPETGKVPVQTALDYEAEYKRLTAPFKANGREIAVKGVDDAITLMQMGANYNKKMAALKPNLKLLKMLENNGLLDAEKLSYLIDLEKKNPKAISKLVKDSGIDPVDLSVDEDSNAYKPTVQSVDDKELELDTVLDEIQGTESYNRTLNIVSKEWDGASKQVIANTPQILKVINDHVQSGIYDLIHTEMENERTFGRLNGLSDIEAYRQVGDRLHAEGAFSQIAGASAPGHQTPPKVIVPPKPKMGNDDKLREKKRAASAPSTASPAKAKPDYNPLALSDEDFAKLVQPNFL